MHPTMAVLVLIVTLQFCITFPAVTGDCYDETLDESNRYDNCDTCYQTLLNALIDTADNKYQLGEMFFPKDDVTPAQVEVIYMSSNERERNLDCETLKNTAQIDTIENFIDFTWYWLTGEIYVYQPLVLFQYRSLFFSPLRIRHKCVILYLPSTCLNSSGQYYDEFFEYLTQRVRRTLIAGNSCGD